MKVWHYWIRKDNNEGLDWEHWTLQWMNSLTSGSVPLFHMLLDVNPPHQVSVFLFSYLSVYVWSFTPLCVGRLLLFTVIMLHSYLYLHKKTNRLKNQSLWTVTDFPHITAKLIRVSSILHRHAQLVCDVCEPLLWPDSHNKEQKFLPSRLQWVLNITPSLRDVDSTGLGACHALQQFPLRVSPFPTDKLLPLGACGICCNCITFPHTGT